MMHPGMIYLNMQKDTVAYLKMEVDQPIEYTCIIMQRGYFETLLQQTLHSEECSLYECLSQSRKSAFLFRTFIASSPLLLAISGLFDYNGKGPDQLYYLELKMNEIMFLLQSCRLKPHADPLCSNDRSGVFDEIGAWLLLNYEQKLTIKSIARTFGLNEFTLKQGFKYHYNRTIHQYIIDLRMQEAQKLILNDEDRIGDIASKIGYRSISHFVQSFKGYYGVTPHSLRNRTL